MQKYQLITPEGTRDYLFEEAALRSRLQQMLADTFNCEVKTVVSKEGPALGVAILAGVGAGIYKSVEEGCRAVIRTNPPQPPIAENVPQYEKFYQIYRSLYPALKDSYQQLAKL